MPQIANHDERPLLGSRQDEQGIAAGGDGLSADFQFGKGRAGNTTLLAVAYKSTMTILVPPGVRVEMTGFGVTQGEGDPGYRLANDAPVIHVRGIAYKGTVEIATRPPDRPALRR